MKKNLLYEFTKGITIENPTFGLVLGLCPTLAVSTSVTNAVGMGAAATFVLLGSNTIVSLIRRLIPDAIRLPCFIVVIATFVTVCEMLLKAFVPALYASLGIFVPLIVVNCIILARAESFASKHALLRSVVDALGMGAGFSLGLVIIAVAREVIGSGTLAGREVLPHFQAATVMVLAPGALLTLGLLIAFTNWVKLRKGEKPRLKKGGCCG